MYVTLALETCILTLEGQIYYKITLNMNSGIRRGKAFFTNISLIHSPTVVLSLNLEAI
jgi:hypothetical protein